MDVRVISLHEPTRLLRAARSVWPDADVGVQRGVDLRAVPVDALYESRFVSRTAAFFSTAVFQSNIMTQCLISSAYVFVVLLVLIIARRLYASRTCPKPCAPPQKINVTIPKNIFLYWHQGFAQAPRFVRHLKVLWERLNPEWRVFALDQHSVENWLTDSQTSFLKTQTFRNIALYSDMLRTYLLITHGGVWADATLMPLRPLERWDYDLGELSAYKYEDAHYKPNAANVGRLGRNGRPVISFFLAAQPRSRYLEKLAARMETYLKQTSPEKRPYFCWHYEFDQLILTDASTRQWFLDPDTGGRIKPYCNVSARTYAAYARLQRAIMCKGQTLCSPSVKLSWKDSRKHLLYSLKGLKAYYASLGTDVSDMPFQ